MNHRKPSTFFEEPKPGGIARRPEGFTFIELLVTISIAAILMTIAVPSFQTFFHNTRMATVSNELLASFSLARSEAIRRGQHVSVCRSSTGTSCAAAGNGWDAGWIVFLNLDNDSPAAVDAANGETVLRVSPPVPSDTTLRPNNNFTNFITYDQAGRANTTGRFVICDSSGLNGSRALFVTTAGRVRIARDANGNGIPEDEAGVDITSCTP